MLPKINEQVTDFFGEPISVGSYAIIILPNSNKFGIYKVTGIGPSRIRSINKQDTCPMSEIILHHRTLPYTVYRYSKHVIIMSDIQFTFYAIKTGNWYNNATDYLGTQIKDDGYCIASTFQGTDLAIYEVNIDSSTKNLLVSTIDSTLLIQRFDLVEPHNVIVLSEQQVIELVPAGIIK